MHIMRCNPKQVQSRKHRQTGSLGSKVGAGCGGASNLFSLQRGGVKHQRSGVMLTGSEGAPLGLSPGASLLRAELPSRAHWEAESS